ncbi:hypothetical protein [Dictyobacter arantiisoli]|uniref:Endonuclease/exonuclease/phosphatase domain-containing protein n=1 Tax=Dictyobacter arantiisoli TaxID=2014874 RepID=A0A5A5TLB9_9CHLR|nr:hypothetical protein [Dictyobacter arantiisoli]GCF11764.1 hypothetical protein KDI_53280 [Dictyobacter arantiisoli]
MVRIVSWNIKQFSLNTWNSQTRRNIILQVFAIADLVFILEGPASSLAAGALADSVVQDLGAAKWDSNYIINPALGNETDSTLIFWKKGTVNVTGVAALAIPPAKSWDSSLRKPAIASVKIGRKNYQIGVWHAPPSTSDKSILIAAAWGVLKTIPGLDLFVGDFNVDVSVSRSEYASKGPDRGTVFRNPSLTSVTDWSDFLISDSRYDKVLVGNSLRNNATLKNSIAICTTPLKPFTFQQIYSVSDHCPVTCVL